MGNSRSSKPSKCTPSFIRTEVSVVHNGIIENSNELKKDLENKGYKFKSQTDTEVITFLLTDLLKNFDIDKCNS